MHVHVRDLGTMSYLTHDYVRDTNFFLKRLLFFFFNCNLGGTENDVIP